MEELKQQRKQYPDKDVAVVSLPTKPQGRPLLLGQELDKAVQDYIEALRVAGGVVNSTIIVAAANGIVSAKDPSLLVSRGGSISINKNWAKSLLSRMKYVKRKCSNAGKVSLPNFKTIQAVFLADLKAEVLMNDVPDELILNWDQTGLPIIPTGQWTMHHAGDKVIPIAHADDKQQITAVLAASLTGKC